MLLFRTIISFLRNEEYRELLMTTMFVLGVGTIYFHYTEGWDWIDSLYFCMITLTTIGYGDFSPDTMAGKIFNMFYILIGLGIILSFINTAYNHYDEMRKTGKKKNGK